MMKSMLATPTFVPNYFQSKFGKEWLVDNPQRGPTEEYLMRVRQRQQRQLSEANGGANSQTRDNQSAKNEFDDGAEEGNEDNPIVALEPEDEEQKGSIRKPNLKASQKQSLEEAVAMPSFYRQEKQFLN